MKIRIEYKERRTKKSKSESSFLRLISTGGSRFPSPPPFETSNSPYWTSFAVQKFLKNKPSLGITGFGRSVFLSSIDLSADIFAQINKLAGTFQSTNADVISNVNSIRGNFHELNGKNGWLICDWYYFGLLFGYKHARWHLARK